jgi:hypothetical protein
MVFGVLAGLFVLLHLIELPAGFTGGRRDLAASWWLGKIAAIIIGSIVCFLLLHGSFRKD